MLITASSEDRGREGRENKLMIQCFCDQILLKVRKKYLCQNVSYKYQVLKIQEVIQMVYMSPIQKASKSQATESQAHMQSCLEILQNMER